MLSLSQGERGLLISCAASVAAFDGVVVFFRSLLPSVIKLGLLAPPHRFGGIGHASPDFVGAEVGWPHQVAARTSALRGQFFPTDAAVQMPGGRLRRAG